MQITINQNQATIISGAVKYESDCRKEGLRDSTSEPREINMDKVNEIVKGINDCTEIIETIDKANMASIGLGQQQ